MKNLVVLGGGYGGMRILTYLLPNQLPEDMTITLIDRMPHHSLKTEYYALAAGIIKNRHVKVEFPRHPRLKVVCGEATKIDLKEKKVFIANSEPIAYDDLVIGLGCEDKYNNVPGAREFANSIQTLEQANKTHEILKGLEPGSVVSIIGGGLSGVEFASQLNESRPDLKIKLFDRGNHILSTFPVRLSTYVENWFDNHGVEIINHSNITQIEPNILYNHHEPIFSDCIIWTAGIQPNILVRELDIEKDRQGRVILTPYHNIPGDEHVYVVGDCASLPYAPSAQLAEGHAEQIAYVLLKRWKEEELPKSLPSIKLKGVIGSLGKKNGFGIVNERPITGRVARILKSGVLWVYKYHKG